MQRQLDDRDELEGDIARCEERLREHGRAGAATRKRVEERLRELRLELDALEAEAARASSSSRVR